MQGNSIQDSMSIINEFLRPARATAQKEAHLKQAMEDNSVSFKDTKPANPEEQAKQQAAATSQDNLGKEQTQAAVDSASNVNSVSSNSEADGNRFWDDQGTKTLDTDQPVKGNGNLGPTRTQEITQEQKTARANHLGNAILDILYKEASAAVPGQAGGTVPKASAAPKPTRQVGAIPNDADGLAAGNDKTAGEVHPFVEKAAAEAAYAAQEYFEDYFEGIMKRANDMHEVSQANIPSALLRQVGGVSGLLDKVAMEFPEAVLPEGAELEGGGDDLAALAGAEGGEEGGMPGGMPDMGGMPGGEEGGDPAEELAAALEEAGVTPEELAQAVEDVTALQEAGIQPEQLAEAMGELTGGGGGEGAPAPEPEAGMEEVEKIASMRLSPVANRVAQILNRNR